MLKYCYWLRDAHTLFNMDPDALDQCTHINNVPDEIIEYIFNLLSPYKCLKSCSLVCKRWNNISFGVARKKIVDFQKFVREGKLDWYSYEKDTSPTITERYSHCSVYHNKSVYVFGGCTATNTTFNDLWRYDLALNQWVRPLAMGSYPSPKACSSLVVYKDSLLLFGGWSHPTPYPLHQAARYFNQLHVYCPSSNRWSCVQASNTPPGKAGHAACVVKHTMFLFGGSQMEALSCNDLWSLDLEEMAWKQHMVPGKLPLPRYGHGLFALDDLHLLMVGGCGGPNMQFTDVWVLDLTSLTSDPGSWRAVQVQGTDNMPAQLWCHPLCQVGDRLVAVSKPNKPLPAVNYMSPGRKHQDNGRGAVGGGGQRPGGSLQPQQHASPSGPHSLLTTQLAQLRRTFPDTSESSSQDSSSDTDDVAGASGAVRPRHNLRHQHHHHRSAASSFSHKQHCCKKCGNHWDVCVCTSDDSNLGATGGSLGNSRNNPMDQLGASLDTAESAEPVGEPITPFRTPFRNGRNMPSIKPNASKNRQKQLETLRKYEEKFRSKMGSAADDVEVKLQGNCIEVKPITRRATNPMYVHTLDISRVLSDNVVSWQPVQASNISTNMDSPPDETIFYSLVPGRGELIMFGGIQLDLNSMQRMTSVPQVVSNNVYFLRPPS